MCEELFCDFLSFNCRFFLERLILDFLKQPAFDIRKQYKLKNKVHQIKGTI